MIALQVSGRIFEGWERIAVTRGLDRAAGSFSLGVSDQLWRIRPGAPCRVELDGEPVITGFVDTARMTYDAGSHGLEVAGRGRTADLIDCSAVHDPGQWNGLTLERLAAILAAPFGVTVRAETSTGDPVANLNLDPGTTPHAEIERLCRLRGLLATDAPDGALVLTRAGAARAAGRIERGRNVLAASVTASMAGRFSRYICNGSQPGGDGISPEDAAGVAAFAEDDGVGRYRPLVIRADAPVNPAAATARARHEAAVRYGRALAARYTLAGWRDADGALWKPNRLVELVDDFAGIERDMLIVAVNFTLDSSGSRTVLDLVRPDAYRQLPTSEVKAAGDIYANIVPGAPGVELKR